MKLLLAILVFVYFNVPAQTVHLRTDKKLSASLQAIVQQTGLDSNFNVDEKLPEQISLAVINLNGKPCIAGVNMDNFIYPASVYKMYVAMEVLKQVSEGKYPLSQFYIVRSPNDVDRTREVTADPRPLLRSGDTVTINYLLDLMITRSDNSAANCLIDIAGRKNINATMVANGWKGSEVTRKFLSRKMEDPGYDTIRGTETNARHTAEFMYRVQTNQLINPWVSMQMKALLARQLDKSKLAQGLPANTMFSHKTGWWSFYTHDAGIVEDGKVKYVLAVFTPVKENQQNGRLKLLAQKVHALMLQRGQNK
jgi:beta-lactamase class A